MQSPIPIPLFALAAICVFTALGAGVGFAIGGKSRAKKYALWTFSVSLTAVVAIAVFAGITT